jgi:hypothetical protein
MLEPNEALSSEPAPTLDADPSRSRSKAARQAARLAKVRRENAIVDLLNVGRPISEIAAREGVIERRMRPHHSGDHRLAGRGVATFGDKSLKTLISGNERKCKSLAPLCSREKAARPHRGAFLQILSRESGRRPFGEAPQSIEPPRFATGNGGPSSAKRRRGCAPVAPVAIAV